MDTIQKLAKNLPGCNALSFKCFKNVSYWKIRVMTENSILKVLLN